MRHKNNHNFEGNIDDLFLKIPQVKAPEDFTRKVMQQIVKIGNEKRADVLQFTFQFKKLGVSMIATAAVILCVQMIPASKVDIFNDTAFAQTNVIIEKTDEVSQWFNDTLEYINKGIKSIIDTHAKNIYIKIYKVKEGNRHDL